MRTGTKSVRIGDKVVGGDAPCFIIAEAGVNHNGDINLAKKLVDAAKNAGADAVKFQTFKAEDIVTRTAEKAAYQKKTTGTKETQYEMLKKLELSEKDHIELKRYADKQGIIFLSTPYDTQSIDFLFNLGVPAFKVSSADITNKPLLAYIAGKKIPVILSTGMSTLGEVEFALKVLLPKNNKIILTHCTFNYPARMEDVNLKAMATMEQAFHLPVGYSDHTPGIEVALAAVAMGAALLEKHFTTDRRLPGPDHSASLEPDELADLLVKVRHVEKAMGTPVKRPSGEEAANRNISRRSVVAAVDIPAGRKITAPMLSAKRPGSGISPMDMEQLIGRKVKVALKKDRLIKWTDLK